MALWGATTRRAIRRGDLWSPAHGRVPPRGAGLPGRGTAFFPKESGGKERAGGVPPGAPQYGGSWRRWAVQTGQRPAAHCRPLRRHKLRIARFAVNGKARSLHCASSPHRTRFAGLRRGPHCYRDRRCRALGGTHRGYPASPESGCAVPPGPPGRHRCHAAEKPWCLRRHTGEKGESS